MRANMWRACGGCCRRITPDDYVLATGEATSVRDFASWAFADAGIPIDFHGAGLDEKGLCRRTGRCLIEIDPRYFRPAEVDLLQGDPTKAREELGWHHRTSARDLAREMVLADMALLRSAAPMLARAG